MHRWGLDTDGSTTDAQHEQSGGTGTSADANPDAPGTPPAQPGSGTMGRTSAVPSDPRQELPTQAAIDADTAARLTAYARARAAGAPVAHHPNRDHPPYRSTRLRHPLQPLVPVHGDPESVELHTPVFGHADLGPTDGDLTRQHPGQPLGERITVSGRVLDRRGRPVRGQLVELWQANSAGRYAHLGDRHPAPLDPNFTGVGRALTDDDGGYHFTTIRPGAYPWRNHHGAWRPAHLHFSVFGRAFAQRLTTQMYFPGDPLFAYDPVLLSIRDEAARQRLVATYDHDLSESEWSLGYRWDIVLDGPSASCFQEEG